MGQLVLIYSYWNHIGNKNTHNLTFIEHGLPGQIQQGYTTTPSTSKTGPTSSAGLAAMKQKHKINISTSSEDCIVRVCLMNVSAYG